VWPHAQRESKAGAPGKFDKLLRPARGHSRRRAPSNLAAAPADATEAMGLAYLDCPTGVARHGAGGRCRLGLAPFRCGGPVGQPRDLTLPTAFALGQARVVAARFFASTLELAGAQAAATNLA